MAESSSAESTNFSAYTSEAESDSEANSSEAGPSSLCLTVYTDVCKIIILCRIMTFLKE